MKKLATIFTAAVMLFSSFAFATDSDNVNARIQAALLNDFSTATNITWEKVNACYIASFVFNNIELNAAYDDNGQLVGTCRQIEISQLPVSVSLALSKKYEGYNFSKKATELTFEGETNYYLSVENERQTLKLKCAANGSIEVDHKIKKK